MEEKIVKGKEESCNCDALKVELENCKKELEQVKSLNSQYEEAYKDLVNRYNRLRGMLDNNIEYALGMKN